MKNVLSVAVLAAIACLSVVFAVGEMGLAAKKPLWLDETYGLGESRQQSYTSFVLRGAISEPSPAPLDYITNKFFIDFKSAVGDFGLKEEVYFRIKPLVAVLLGLLVIVVLVVIEGASQSAPIVLLWNFLLFCIPFAYFFQTQIFFYSIETRSYALWVALYAWVLAASFRSSRRPWLLTIALSLMACTSIAALYQSVALLVAFWWLRMLQQDKWQPILKQALIIFAIPLLITGYYCYLSGTGFMDRVASGGTWADFRDFWTNKLVTIPLMLFAAGICLYRRETQSFALAPLGFLIYYLMGPAIYYLTTHVRGYFYAERQFICYDLTYVVLILTVLFAAPVYISRIKSQQWQWMVAIVLCCAIGALTFPLKKMHKFKDVCREFSAFVQQKTSLFK